MHILGLSFFYHDSAAALLRDGEIIAAAEEERFTRIKHDHNYPQMSIDFCLLQAGITFNDLDYVVFYEKPLVKFERVLMSILSTFPNSWGSFGEAMIAWLDQKLWIKDLILEKTGISPEKLLFSDHHMSHAASAFLASPYEEAAILTLDGVGEWTTSSMGFGRASWKDGVNEIVLSHEERFPHSIGLLYSTFTAFLGFEVNEGEYKVMGMSPYGEPRYIDKVEKLFKVYDDGSFWMDMDYFSYQYSPEKSFSRKFIKLFGEPRIHESEFFTPKTNPEVNPDSPKARENQYYADVAASIQIATEEAILKIARTLSQKTRMKKLCFAGGVALNSKANGRLLTDGPFEEIYIQPSPGDSGGAIGAALYVYHVVLGKPRRWVQEHNFLGSEYNDADIQAAINLKGYPYERIDDSEKLISRTVDDIIAGKVIGWYQGRFEWGPRALGNRSILADPRRAEMKNIVNSKIKFREPFRPFAPVILEKQTTRYFPTLKEPEKHYLPRFMLAVLPWDETLGQEVPAVNHLGTGRLQTIRYEWNPWYYRLVELFGEATSVPIIMNTSFNLRGEPIVTTPADALRTFGNSGIDTLVMGNYRVTKD
jgi:carbamoyltransferase